MANHLVTTAWGPGLIGQGISSIMYGASLAQLAHYLQSFPNDLAYIRLVVHLAFTADTLHLIGTTQFYWTVLVLCHRSDATVCATDLPWGLYVAVPMNYIVIFAVQSFYSHRIWIITGNKRSITLAVLIMAILQFALGAWASLESIKDGTIEFLYTTPLVPLAAGAGTLCDIVITSTIFKYLWRSELQGRTSLARGLVIVFINMGALTCLVSIIVGAVFLMQGNRYLVGAPAEVVSRCYINSLLAVLNARRTIREREARRLMHTIELPSIQTIH